MWDTIESAEGLQFTEEHWHMDELIIGIGANGCDILNAYLTEELKSEDYSKGIMHWSIVPHRMGISDDPKVLEACMAECKVLVTPHFLSIQKEVQPSFANVMGPKRVFIVVCDKNSSDVALATHVARFFALQGSCVLGFLFANSGKYSPIFAPLLKFIHVMYPLPYENAVARIIRFFKATFGAEYEKLWDKNKDNTNSIHLGKKQEHFLGIQACVGYGLAHGDKPSDRVERAVKQTLQSISLPAWKIFSDTYATDILARIYHGVMTGKSLSDIYGADISIVCNSYGDEYERIKNSISKSLSCDVVDSGIPCVGGNIDFVEIHLIAAYDTTESRFCSESQLPNLRIA